MEQTTLSAFLRRSGAVLDAVAEQDVLVTRRDGADLVLTTASRMEAVRQGLRTLARALKVADTGPGTRAPFAPAPSPQAAFLSPEERRRMLVEVAEAALVASELGVVEPLERTLDRWQRLARLRARVGPLAAHDTRPVAIPDDVDDPSVAKAAGVVELPPHVRWSHPRRSYDLNDPRQLRRVYEQVLREGTEEDVARYVDVDTLIAEWDSLVLPARVRRAWAQRLRERRGVELAC